VLIFGTGHAAAMDAADWATFEQETYGQYWQKNSPPDFEDLLYTLYRRYGRTKATIVAFAQATRVSVAEAARNAEDVVAIVKRRQDCEEPPIKWLCWFGPGDPLFALAHGRAMDEKSGLLMVAVGISLESWSSGYGDAVATKAKFVRLAAKHPARDEIFARLLEFDHQSPASAAGILSSNPLGEAAAERLLGIPSDIDTLWDGWELAMAEAAERAAGSQPPRIRAILAEFILSIEIRLGLTQNAADRYRAYPDEIKALLPYWPAHCVRRNRACDPDRYYAFADSLAAALWRQDHAIGLVLLREHRDSVGVRRYAAANRFDALEDAMEPRIANDQLFDRYMDHPPTKDDDHNSKPGWLAVVNSPAAVSAVVALRLRMAGYHEIAISLERREPYHRNKRETPGELAHFSFLFSEPLEPARARWAALIEADRADRAKRAADASEQSVVISTLAPAFAEHRLPDGMAPWKGNTAALDTPKDLELPVNASSVLRYERTGAEQALIFRSQEYDLAGEIPAYGIWFAHTQNGTWAEAAYLGLQAYFPYVVTPGSALTMVKDGHLRIEVQAREIDPDSITYPPVATRLKRVEDGLWLDFDLALVTADSDADGLSDIAEHRLGLNPGAPDTDKDGLLDGSDPVPLTPFDRSARPEDVRAAVTILKTLYRFDEGAIIVAPSSTKGETLDDILAAVAGGPRPQRPSVHTMFVVGDPALFAGVRTPFRLIVYTPTDLNALARDGDAPFLPPHIVEHFRSLDGNRHFVEWSAGWVGGSFLMDCSKGLAMCGVSVISSWIT